MARRRDSSIFSSGKTYSRIPTIFFSSNKRKSEYLNTVLEQSLLLTSWHQKECAHMNKTCTAIDNITNDALTRIVKIKTRNSYSLKIKKTLHTWGIFNSRYLIGLHDGKTGEQISKRIAVCETPMSSLHSFSVEKKYL